MTLTRDQKALQYDPWGDGKGDDNYRIFRNQFVQARYAYECGICGGPISKGQRHRAQTEKDLDGSGKVMTFRFCVLCCDAMAASWTDAGELICERYEIGQRAARKRRAA